VSDKPIVMFGVGELAEVAAFYFEAAAGPRVVSFCVDAAHLKEPTFLGRPVVPLEEVASRYPASAHDGFVAVGYSRINGLRQEKCEAMRGAGYHLASYVSQRANIASNVTCGWNAFILEDNTIQPFVTIGDGVTLWSGNHIGHHARIGSFAFISSHVVVSGGVRIGARSFIGVNATLNDHLSIGERCVIGSGALIVKDVPDEGVMTAEAAKLSPVPSRRLRGF
jgi:sugar O-acyltransferase (sialic acid O-acetyltransferase NeuD family)